MPVDPSYLSWQVRRKLGTSFRFVELANDVNDHMPSYAVRRLQNILNNLGKPVNGSTVLVVGVAYKPETGDLRESPSIRIISHLQELGAIIIAADDHVPDFSWFSDIERVPLNKQTIERSDAAIIVTPHSSFDLGLLDSIPVLDTRHVHSGPTTEVI